MIAKEQHTRFRGCIWFPKEDTYVIVGGVGGIGSWVTLALSRAGFKTIIYDNDILEEANMAGQFYPRSTIGKTKVEAMKALIKDFTDEEILSYNKKVDQDTPTHVYVISAFDNMLARKQMFNKWYNYMAENPHLREKGIFIDGRLEAEVMFIYCVRGSCKEDVDNYIANYLPDDNKIPEVSCTMKQTTHAAMLIAGHITGFFTNHITNVVEKEDVRNVPFRWEYFIPLDLMTFENSKKKI